MSPCARLQSIIVRMHVLYGACMEVRSRSRSITMQEFIKQMGDSKSLIAINMKRLWDDRGTLAPWIEPLSAFLDDGTIAPVVHAAVPFDRARDAHRILAARENVGKVVLVP